MSNLKNKIAVRLHVITEEAELDGFFTKKEIAHRQAELAMKIIFEELVKHDTIMAVCKHPMSASMTKARIEAVINYLNEVKNV